jgi:hypothetical protein
MTLDRFSVLLRERAPYLCASLGHLSMLSALAKVGLAVGCEGQRQGEQTQDFASRVWLHIEATNWQEKVLEPREQALTTLASQIATYAAKKRYLTAVFTRQIERLAENRIEEAVLQVEDGHRAAIGWSSW